MEWISVKDKSPEEGVTVLTWDGSYIRTAEILYKIEKSITWLDGGVCFEHVSHWMELPEPPKEAEC
jgi:hypothetical protein